MSRKSLVRRIVPWVVVLGVAGAGAWWLLGREKETGAPSYRTEKVEMGAVRETVTATGSISAVTTVQVGSQVSGIVARLHADFNSPVGRGQLLAELDPTPFETQVEQRRADLAQAEVQLRRAQINLDRQTRLLEAELSPQADFDTAQADFDAAATRVDQTRAALQQSETNLAYTKILSPIDGVVVARQYDVGQTVAASFQAPTLFTIAQDLTKMQVEADVDQADIGKIRVGQKATFTVDAYPDSTFAGEISQVRLNATVNQNVITYPVILTVDNRDEKLRPEMTANVTIGVATEENVLRVPNAALRFRPVETAETARNGRDTDRAAAQMGRGQTGVQAAGALLDAAAGPRGDGRRRQTVYLLSGPSDLKPVSVRTGITDGRFTAIVEGDLKVGDTVVVGIATSKVEGTGGFPGTQPGGGPRGGPGGRRGF